MSSSGSSSGPSSAAPQAATEAAQAGGTKEPSSTSCQPPKKTGAVKEGEVTTFQDFADRSVVKDKLEGHEVWQHANLKSNGLATTRLSTAASQNNPVIALSQSTHKAVNAAQRGLDAASQTPIQNIEANIKILRDLKAAPSDTIELLEKMAKGHANSMGF